MLAGYARVSTRDRNPDLQLDALSEAGCGKIFTEQRSGARRDRPELAKALGYVCAGDVLVVWKLDRLARSLRQLIETVGRLEEEAIGFRSLTEAIDTTTPGGRLGRPGGPLDKTCSRARSNPSCAGSISLYIPSQMEER